MWNKNLLATLTLCAVAIVATAQGFESLRRTTVAETKASPTLAAFLDQNDAEGLRSFLKANPHSVNDGTLKCAIKTGARRMKSLLYDAVERTLAGQVSPDVPAVVLQAGASFTTAFEGKTPIYLVLDYLARHKKSECATAEQLLQSFVERSDFDANMRYRSLLPPLAYLIRENYQFLGNRFSADYISDNALRTLIEHGASINTYNTDGGTLMAFATATNNEYMQSYIIGNGIDLTHADQSGNDDIYRTIDAGNLPLLRQMIERAHVKVDINTLKNNTADVRQRYSELYDFLATHCARQAQGYDEVTLFRQRFDDKKPLVQQKYETLAEAEAKGATSFAHFMRVQERYPGTESLLNGRKLEIYHGDCSQLAALYQRTVQVAEAGGTMKHEKTASTFLDTYTKRYHYDPDRKAELAQEVENFLQVSDALQVQSSPDRYWEWFVNFLNIRTKPKFYSDKVNQDKDLLERGMYIASTGSIIKAYSNYYERNAGVLSGMYSKLRSDVEEAVLAYNNAVSEHNAQTTASRARASAERSRRETEERQDQAIEDMGVPDYKVESDWREVLISALNYGAEEIMEIRFTDPYKKVTIGRRNTGNGYVYRAWNVGYEYKTLSDAITAAYVYAKYKKVRQTGRYRG